MFINYTTESGISISSYRHPECYYGNIVDMARDIKNGYNISCPLEGAMDALEDASLWKDVDLEIIEDIYNSIIEYMYEQEEEYEDSI